MEDSKNNLLKNNIDIMVENYQNKNYIIAQDTALLITKNFPDHVLSWKILGITYEKTGHMEQSLIANQKAVKFNIKDAESHNNLGSILSILDKLDDAEKSYKKSIELKKDYALPHYNLGGVLKKLNKLNEAKESYKRAIELKPDYLFAYNNLGNIYYKLKNFNDAEASYRKGLKLSPDYALLHYNLANTLHTLDKFEQAILSYRKAIELKPSYTEAYCNLGVSLKELNKLDEAEISFRKAIDLNPNYFVAYNNLGTALQDLGQLEEAIKVYKKAIDLNPKYIEAYNNLGVILQDLGRVDEATANYEKVIELNPTYTTTQENKSLMLRENEILSKILKLRIRDKKKKNYFTNSDKLGFDKSLFLNPFISNRAVELELINNLYDINSKGLNKTRGVFFGNGRHSQNFQLFENNYPIINKVKEDLISIMSKAVKSDVCIIDSFFNILSDGGGSVPHTHLTKFDKTNELTSQKYSLTYYLSVGDQNCSKPGIFKTYDPDKEFLPSNGMIMIIPAHQMHSADYNGKKDRIMIGVNFYSLHN